MQEVECRIFLIFLKFRSLYHMSSTRLGYPFIISHNSFLANNNWHGVFVLTVLPLVTLAKKMTVRLPFFWMVRCSGMQQCKSNGQEHQATGDNGGVRIEGAGPFRRLTTSTMNRARRNCSTTLVQNLLAVCASVYHQISSQQGGTYNHRVFTITQDQMDDRGIIPTLGGIDHLTPGGIVATMGGINPSNAGKHHSNYMWHHFNHRHHCSPHGNCHCSNDGRQSSYNGCQISNDG